MVTSEPVSKCPDISDPPRWCRNVLGLKCLRSEVSVHLSVNPSLKIAFMFVQRNIISRHSSILLNMNKSFVCPHLEYCSPVWSPHYKKYKVLLERVQHRFTRLFCHLRQLDYSARLDILGLWSLEEQRNRADLIEVFKITRGYSSIPVDSFFKVSKDGCTRGHTLKLVKHRTDKDLHHHFFSERVVNRWNQLDKDAVEATY